MFVSLVEQVPDAFDHIGAMGVDDQVFGFVVVARDMRIRDPLRGQALHELDGIIAMVDRVHVDVVDIDQQVTVRFCEHSIDEFNFLHLGSGRRCVVGRVFHRDALTEDVLYTQDAFGDVIDSFFGKRNRQQVIQMAIVRAVGQVL